MILSNILEHLDGVSVLHSLNVDYHVLSENVWNLATHNPEYIISLEDCEKVSNEFPNIKFIYPNAKFPNFNLKNKTVFNLIDYYAVKDNPSIKNSNAEFGACVVAKDPKFKFDIKNLSSEYKIDCYGLEIGQSTIQYDTNNEFEIYKDYPICVGTNLKQMLKINFLNKWAISFFDFPYSFGENYETYIKKTAYMNAVNSTYHDLYAGMFKSCNPKLTKIIKLNKKEILKEIKTNEKN